MMESMFINAVLVTGDGCERKITVERNYPRSMFTAVYQPLEVFDLLNENAYKSRPLIREYRFSQMVGGVARYLEVVPNAV